MEQAKIDRINVLARKSKTEGLTEAEKEEQAALRREYVAAVKRNLTAQLEGGTITLTDHAAGETYTGTLAPAEDAAPNAQIYTLVFPDQPEGYGVYGVTEYADGSRDATLYLTINAQTLCLTAPLES